MQIKKRKYLAAVAAVLGTSALSTSVVNADETHLNLAQGVTSGSFDLTKQVTGNMTFPVMFDRPSGLNAAALASTVRELGTSSNLYRSALNSVPELADNERMNNLLSNAVNGDSDAKETIVKLINWYNTLGGTKITTQSGAKYTADNLSEPINVLAVAFSNNDSVNSQATASLAEINAAKTVGDVETALNKIQSGLSTPYDNAFANYAAKVYAQNADLGSLAQYSAVSGVLNAYEGMYANGASAIRKTLLNNQTSSTEAGVTFFESAVLAGNISQDGGDNSDSNKPSQKTDYHTRWVDDSGKDLKTPDTNQDGYKEKADISGYKFVSDDTNDSTHTKTYHYTKLNPDDKGQSHDENPSSLVTTHWVDESGKTLLPDKSGSYPDNDGVSDVPGYDFVKTTTDNDGNVTNVYRKHEDKTPDVKHTYWVDTDGKTLLPSKEGTFPDNDGVSDVPNYDLVASYTVTDKDVASSGQFAGTAYKAGDTINIYKKHNTSTVHTTWVDTNGKTLKPQEDGAHPDNDGVSDIPGYKPVTTKTDKDGNVTNIYEKMPTVHTTWVDTNGKTLKPEQEGSYPDNDGVSDIPGYKLVKTTTDKDGNVTNVYEALPNVHTRWIDTEGKTLKPEQEGAYPDNDGVSDIDGYKLVATKTDADGNVTNIYKKVITTSWVDENGKELKSKEEGSHPDNDGVSDVPGYKLVKTSTDKDGNVVNTYEKIVHTTWVDTKGETLKPQEDGSHPDNDGMSDIPGYKLVKTETDKDGNINNIYEKIVHTTWVDQNGKTLKPEVEGSYPDNDGVSDIPGYKLVKTETDKDGNINNIYEKIVYTAWVDQDGNSLKDKAEGSFPDNDGVSDIDGYELVKTTTDDDGNVTNVYKKIVYTTWVDQEGNSLKDKAEGSFPDNDGVSDIDGYELVRTITDKDGNVTNIYKKIEKAKKTAQPAAAPVTTTTPAAATTTTSGSLPQTGENDLAMQLATILGFAGLVSGAIVIRKKRNN